MLIDGKKIRDEIKESLKQKIKRENLKLRIDFVYVGENPIIDKFINLKVKFAEEIGVEAYVHRLNRDTSGEELRIQIEKLVLNREVNGIVIQLPLPPHIDTKTVLNLIPREKDPDLLSEEAFLLFKNGINGMMPPVIGAIKEIFVRNNVNLKSKKIIVIGKGELVGLPISIWLSNQDIEHISLEKGDDIEKYTKDADIIISGAGSPNIINPEIIKEEAVLIDVGTSSIHGQIFGDIDKECAKKASLFSPVPGGVGPITISILFRNFTLLNSA